MFIINNFLQEKRMEKLDSMEIKFKWLLTQNTPNKSLQLLTKTQNKPAFLIVVFDLSF